ncbi:MAG: peptidoglycan editing factor PgeF [bacterium]
MKLKDLGKTKIYISDKIEKYPEVITLSTTRFYEEGSFNMSISEKTFEKDSAPGNRKRLAELLGISTSNFIFSKQIHSNNILVIDSNKYAGRGSLIYDSAIDDNDGYVTNIPNICLCIISSDCTPVFFYDPIKKVIGAVHAGRKGTFLNITGMAVEKMKSIYGSNSKDIIACIGPAIGSCHYEIGPEIVDEMKKLNIEKYIVRKADKGHAYIDLEKMNVEQLIAAGLNDENIEASKLCTICNDDFFSYRQYGAGSSQLASGIMLKY